MKKVLFAMSGGVDSSVAAALLIKEGYEVSGGTFIHYGEQGENSPEAQNAKKVCDILIDATLSAAKEFSHTKIAVAGGVSANSELRARFEKECSALGYKLYFPPLSLCGDNAAMVGAQAIYEFENNCIAKSDLNAYATYSIDLKE